MDHLLKEKRLALGLTLEEVGNKVGVGKSTVRKWEQGMIENMGRDKIVSLSKALQLSPIDILGIDIPETLSSIYSQLKEPSQKRVYNFAKKELDNQNKIIPIKETQTVYINSKLSAGTGIIDLDPNDIREIEYNGYIPKHDLAFIVDGFSMLPLFKDGEIVFVEKTPDVYNGQVIAVQINESAFLKKVYIEDDCLRLVSLNKDYEDIIANDEDNIRVIGRVIL